MRLRSELRTRWRSWLGLALLIGLAGGGRCGGRGGRAAHRDGLSAVRPGPERLRPDHRRVLGEDRSGRALAKMEALPEVAQWARIDVAASSAILPSGRVALSCRS